MTDTSIDVQKLIARYSNAEHVAHAEAYFSHMPDDVHLLRKPFVGLDYAPQALYGGAQTLNCLKLFKGARVLDFGAAFGWFSKMLAFMGCQAVAVDVSRQALDIGRAAFERDPLAKGMQGDIEWRWFDGERLPLGDASVDRIVCYDSFHHVADQAAVLREFYRVLRDGGRVAFHEPGPNHSRQPEAQYEMRHHAVIENDIVVEDISRMAEAIGFAPIQMAVAAPKAATVPLAAYSRIIHGQATAEDTAIVLSNIAVGAINLRLFFFDKHGQTTDSRQPVGLAGRFHVAITQVDADGIKGHARVTNTGTARWLRSGPELGNVALGVKRLGVVGGPDYGRVWLSGNGLTPGETVEVTFELPPPAQLPVDLVFDLVAEDVVWFEAFGTIPQVVRIELPT